MVRLIIIIVVLGLLALGATLVLTPVPFEPQAWTPPLNPGMTGDYSQNTVIRDRARRFADKIGLGPEDVAVKDGFAYTGLEDGRIMKIPLSGGAASEVVNTGGRPLGLHFDAKGDLIVADAIKGLIAVGQDGTVRLLTDSVNKQPMLFVDDLDIGADGIIWFSDASQRFAIKQYLNDLWEGSATGRLLTYDPATGQTKVVLEGLRFANGVALSADGQFVLVNETAARRIVKLWIAGAYAGRKEILVNGLPCYPDNLARNEKGDFWVACPSPANEAFEQLMPQPFLRAMMYRLAAIGLAPQPVPAPRGWANQDRCQWACSGQPDGPQRRGLSHHHQRQ